MTAVERDHGEPASELASEPSPPTADAPAPGEQAAASDASAHAQARAQRRILLVGEALATALRPRLVRCMPEATVAVVRSFLFAMGEAAHRPADVVISSADQLAGMAESASASLRELLPESRLVVVAPPADDSQARREADAAMRGGFDVCLEEPITDEALRSAVGSVASDTVGDEAAQAWGAPAVLPWGSPSPTASAPSESESPAAPAPAPETPADDSEDCLGDVDLVEALIDAHDQLDTLAIKLVAQRSGIEGIAWTRRRAEIPPDRTQCPVNYRQRTLGFLHAPATTSAQTLAGWAGWLARWLALREHMAQLESLSMTDELTGAWNRRYFNRFLARIIEQARTDRSQVTLLVFDIDDFKCYNDRYGHAAGDEILREATKLIQSFVREHDVVARIGGDEFAVIFWDAEQKRRPDSAHPHTVREAAKRFQKAICAHRFPKLLDEAPGTLTISGGLASYPWDGRTPEELLERADEMALQSKRQGKNAITFGPGALRDCQTPDAPDARDASEHGERDAGSAIGDP